MRVMGQKTVNQYKGVKTNTIEIYNMFPVAIREKISEDLITRVSQRLPVKFTGAIFQVSNGVKSD